MVQHVSSGDSEARTLQRGLSIMSLFGAGRPALMQSEIAALLQLPLATVGRLCRTLVIGNFLEQSPPTRQLWLGSEINRLSGTAAEGISEGVRRWMRVLNEQFDEEVNLAMLDGAHALYLDSVSSSRVLRTRSPVGVRISAHCTAVGKCLLSQLESRVVLDRLGRGPYEIRTGQTLHRWTDLRKELESIRDAGVAHSIDEYEEGLSGFAVPLGFARTGLPLALSIAVPTVRTSKTRIQEIADTLLARSTTSSNPGVDDLD